jgi:mannonate dehydratase
MRRPSRRTVLTGLGLTAGALAGVRCALPWWLAARPVRALEELSEDARALAAGALDGLDLARVIDLHVHVAGLGGAGSGCWVNPRMQSHLHPFERLRFELYLAAGGAPEDERADRLYVERLLALVRAFDPRVRLLLYAFDVRVDNHGVEDLAHSMFRVPDEHVLALARAYPEFLACVSVHPHRKDALARLEAARAGGAVAVKWLPPAMGIDPSEARHGPYYAKLAELGLALLVHTGEERAVWSADAQELGNPLHLRAPLAAGVRVVALHCASLGELADLDAPGAPPRSGFELFLRLLEEAGPDGGLFGELSATVQQNRDPAVLATLLARPALHGRLLNGSDYPLVALDPLTSLGKLVRAGLIATEERAALRELFEANPLLFDFVLKRRLRRVEGSARHAFAPGVFETARLFDKL